MWKGAKPFGRTTIWTVLTVLALTYVSASAQGEPPERHHTIRLGASIGLTIPFGTDFNVEQQRWSSDANLSYRFEAELRLGIHDHLRLQYEANSIHLIPPPPTNNSGYSSVYVRERFAMLCGVFGFTDAPWLVIPYGVFGAGIAFDGHGAEPGPLIFVAGLGAEYRTDGILAPFIEITTISEEPTRPSARMGVKLQL
jgi:hypothetical protein